MSTAWGRTVDGLLDRAEAAEEPVVDVIENDRSTQVIAVSQPEDGLFYRVEIDTVHPESETRVRFGSIRPDSDLHVLQTWSSHYHGRLGGPMSLGAWEQWFTLFNAALGRYRDPPEGEEVCPENDGGSGQ